MLAQLVDGVADGGLIDAKLGRGFGERAVFVNPHKGIKVRKAYRI